MESGGPSLLCVQAVQRPLFRQRVRSNNGCESSSGVATWVVDSPHAQLRAIVMASSKEKTARPSMNKGN